MSDAAWYYRLDGKKHGPLTLDALCALFKAGTLTLGAEVWNDAFGRWIAADKIEGFRTAAAMARPAATANAQQRGRDIDPFADDAATTDVAAEDAEHSSAIPPRLQGIFCLAGAAFVGYISIYLPLEEARQHASSVSLYMKGTILLPFLAVWGVALLLLGDDAKSLLGSRNKVTGLGLVSGIILLAVGVGIFTNVKSRLADLGYTESRPTASNIRR
jgi:hypothetical protein